MESIWHRASKNTEKFRKENKLWFWGVNVVGSGAITSLIKVLLWDRSTLEGWQAGLITFGVFVLGLFFIYGLIFIYNLFRALLKRRFYIEIQSLIEDGTMILERMGKWRSFGDIRPFQEFKDWREKGKVILMKYNYPKEESLWYSIVGTVDMEQVQQLSGRVSEACNKGLELLETMLRE